MHGRRLELVVQRLSLRDARLRNCGRKDGEAEGLRRPAWEPTGGRQNCVHPRCGIRFLDLGIFLWILMWIQIWAMILSTIISHPSKLYSFVFFKIWNEFYFICKKVQIWLLYFSVNLWNICGALEWMSNHFEIILKFVYNMQNLKKHKWKIVWNAMIYLWVSSFRNSCENPTEKITDWEIILVEVNPWYNTCICDRKLISEW
jgi:hypothetical protein